MAVESSAGSSATQGSVAETGSRSSGNTKPVAPSRLTSTALTAAIAARVVVLVQPVHHLRSSSVPGPNAASHCRASSACAVGVSRAVSPPGSQAAMGAQRYWLDVHAPRGRPRTMRSSAASSVRTQVVIDVVPPHDLPSPVVVPPPLPGRAAGHPGGEAPAPPLERGDGRLAHTVEPGNA